MASVWALHGVFGLPMASGSRVVIRHLYEVLALLGDGVEQEPDGEGAYLVVRHRRRRQLRVQVLGGLVVGEDDAGVIGDLDPEFAQGPVDAEGEAVR
jgi:hypothetical protein